MARTESLGRVGGGREAGYAAGLVSKAHRQQDGSKFRKPWGRPRVDEETERLLVRMAKENPGWGYDRNEEAALPCRSLDLITFMRGDTP